MIVSFFLQVLYALVSTLVNFLPTGGLPASIETSLISVWGYVNAFSYVIALSTLIQVLLLYIAFDLVVLLWHLIQWIIRKVPGMQ